MSWPAATSRFLREDNVTLEKPSVAVCFRFFAAGSSSCLVKHIHLEALEQFGYFSSLESFRNCQGETPEIPGQLELNMPQNVRMEDIFAFVLYLYEGHMPTTWREVYSIWCLCDYLVAPYEWRSKLLNRLWQSVKAKDIPVLRQLADGSPELTDFCDKAEKFVSVDSDELHQLLAMLFQQEWSKESEKQERIFQKVERVLSQVDSCQVLATLLDFLENPVVWYVRGRERPAHGRPWQLWIGRVYASEPVPRYAQNAQHCHERSKPVYDILGLQLRHRRFHWLWRQILPLIEHPEWVVHRWRSVTNVFKHLTDPKHLVRCRCTILQQVDRNDELKYQAVASECTVPLNQILEVDNNPRFGAVDDLVLPSNALEDMLLIGCKLLASDCISTQEFLTLLDIGAPPKPNIFRLSAKQFSRVLYQVPGMHSAMVRKHILACKALYKSNWGCEGLLSAILDMF